MNDMSHRGFETVTRNVDQPIGVVLEIAGSGSMIALDRQRIEECGTDEDPAVALSGQVGSQIKIRVGTRWLLASVRTQKHDSRNEGGILANIDFLGEGKEEKLTGRIHSFRRGVTNYPIPGAMIYPASSKDLREVYAGNGSNTIEIGTVFPTRDIRASLYVDQLLGKHFALLGSTGTGKSTSLALILHRICAAAPQGHILMIDPHGEYSAAFKETGLLLDVSNLQLPYWLMNFEEHCEILLQGSGDTRQTDAEILARCLTQARQKNRLAENMGKITVDSPIPYLLSDLSNILQNEMGKLDKATNTAPFMRIKTRLDELKADLRYQFLFSGMLVGDTMAEFIGRISVCLAGAGRFRSSTCRGCRRKLPRPWWRCCRVWCSISPFGRARKRPAPSCWCARKHTVMCRPRRTLKAPRWAIFWRVSPRRAANTVFRWA